MCTGLDSVGDSVPVWPLRPAIEEQCVAGAGQQRDELVHDPTPRAHIPLCLAAHAGERDRFGLPAVEVRQRQRRHDGQRGRRTHARAAWGAVGWGAGDERVHPVHACAHLPGDHLRGPPHIV
jgi:hypothetical protein